MEQKPFKRPLLISLSIILAVLVGGLFTNIEIVIAVCMLAVLWQIVRLLYYAVRDNAHGLKLCGIRLLMWMAGAIAAGFVLGHYAAQGRIQGEALVAALQTYRAREGRYPDKLEALAPRDIAEIPVKISWTRHQLKFMYRGTGKNFRLMYVYAFFMGSEYDSDTAKWEAID